MKKVRINYDFDYFSCLFVKKFCHHSFVTYFLPSCYATIFYVNMGSNIYGLLPKPICHSFKFTGNLTYYYIVSLFIVNIITAERKAHQHQKPMRSWLKQRFIPKMVKAKNAMASGVRCSAWLYF